MAKFLLTNHTSAKSRDKTPKNKQAQSNRPLYRILAWAAVIMWAAFIFFMSAHTGSSLSTGFFGTVKAWLAATIYALTGFTGDVVSPLCHFLEYTLLGFLLAHALGYDCTAGRAFVLAFVLTGAWGISDEIHQIFVPGRTCDPADWAIDILGAAIGAGVRCAFARCTHRAT